MPVVTRQRTPVDVSILPIGAPGLQRAFLRAHVSIETAGGRNVFNHNVGNLSASPDSESPVWEPTWVHDTTHPNHARMLRGEAPAAFRAYPTLADGIRDYGERLNTRFQSMLAARTPREFVEAWRSSGYSPFLDVERTLPNFEAQVERFLPGSGGSDGDNWLGAIGGAILAGAGWLLWAILRGGKSAP